MALITKCSWEEADVKHLCTCIDVAMKAAPIEKTHTKELMLQSSIIYLFIYFHIGHIKSSSMRSLGVSAQATHLCN